MTNDILNTIAFGVEIETVGRTRQTVASAIRAIVGGEVSGGPGRYAVIDAAGRTWAVVSDGSLCRVAEHLRAEVVTPILYAADIPQLQEVIRSIRRVGAQCDETCGIHLHLSHPNQTASTLANLAKIVYKHEDMIYAALGVVDARKARYCKPMDAGFIARIQQHAPRTDAELNCAWYDHRTVTTAGRYDSSRYHILNLNGYFYRGAVEIRAYAGSLHAGKVKAAILFGLALYAKALTAKVVPLGVKRTFDPASAKYDFRVFLVSGLKMIGAEFATTRQHLLALMPGNGAWKHGRPTTSRRRDEEMTACAG